MGAHETRRWRATRCGQTARRRGRHTARRALRPGPCVSKLAFMLPCPALGALRRMRTAQRASSLPSQASTDGYSRGYFESESICSSEGLFLRQGRTGAGAAVRRAALHAPPALPALRREECAMAGRRDASPLRSSSCRTLPHRSDTGSAECGSTRTLTHPPRTRGATSGTHAASNPPRRSLPSLPPLAGPVTQRRPPPFHRSSKAALSPAQASASKRTLATIVLGGLSRRASGAHGQAEADRPEPSEASAGPWGQRGRPQATLDWIRTHRLFRGARVREDPKPQARRETGAREHLMPDAACAR